MCSCSMISQEFLKNTVETSRVCVSAGWVWGGLPRAFVGGRESTSSRSCLSMLWSSITDMFRVDNNFQQSLVVKKPSDEEEAAANTRKYAAQILNLGVAFSASIYMSSRPSRALYIYMCHTNVYHVSRWQHHEIFVFSESAAMCKSLFLYNNESQTTVFEAQADASC